MATTPSLSTPSAPELRVRRRLTWMGAGVICYALFLLIARAPALAEWLFSAPILHVPSWLLSRVTNWVPFALVEWVVVAMVLVTLVWIVRGLGAVRRRERSAGHLAVDALLRAGACGGALVTAFYLTLGHYFARPPLQDRLGLTLADSVTAAELSAVVTALADSTNAAYLRLHGGRADTTVTVVTEARRREAAAALDRAWGAAVRAHGLDAALGWSHGLPKAPLLSAVKYERRQPGQYVFFTGEAMVARGNPVLQWAKTVAHEQAHQRGVAHEGDANFLAYLVGRETDDDLVRYAVSHFAFEQLLTPLFRTDRRAAMRAYLRLSDGVRADLRARDAYFSRPRDRVSQVARAVNDAYLRSQGVRDGVASYGHSAKLILALHRRQRARELGFNAAKRLTGTQLNTMTDAEKWWSRRALTRSASPMQLERHA